MRNSFLLLCCLAIMVVIILTAGSHDIKGTKESTGMFSNTGSPGDGGELCTGEECHSGGASVKNAWLLTDIDTNYSPQKTYTITVDASGGKGKEKGFSIVAENSSKKPVGIFTSIDENTKVANNHVSHTKVGITKNSWTFKWTAPGPGEGDITFYMACMVNGHSDGVITATATFREQVTGVNEINEQSALRIYPNPASENLHVDMSNAENALVTIYSIDGQNVLSGFISGGLNSHTFDISTLKAGIYLVQVERDRKVYTQKLVVK